MARVTVVHTPADYPAGADEKTKTELNELFATLFPGVENPAFDAAHDGVAIAALNPSLALSLAKMSGLISLNLPWSGRTDLRDLAIQTVNVHFNCHYGFRSRIANAVKAGLSEAQQNDIPRWQSSELFNDEQRLVIEYSYAVVHGAVSGELFDRVKAQYGEKGTVEFTSVVAFFSSWAMILNATRPDDMDE